jgi:hypothetical protein
LIGRTRPWIVSKTHNQPPGSGREKTRNTQNDKYAEMRGKIRQDARVHRMTDRERVLTGVVQGCEKFGGRGCAHGGSGAAHVVRITARESGSVA